MTDEVYTTQLMITSTVEGEDVVSLYRRVQLRLWKWLEEEFPYKGDTGGILDIVPFDSFASRRSWSVRAPENDKISGRYLETEKIMTQGIQIMQAQPSVQVPDQSDNTLVTDVCVEAPKIDHPMINGVCFSCKVAILCQPFAGFFTRHELPLTAPRVVKDILGLDGCRIAFHPFGKGTFNDACKYDVSNVPLTVASEKDEDDFLSMLKDGHRPVCLVVFMGDGWRQMREANRIADVVSSKAIVCVLRESERLVSGMEQVVKGIDARRDFREGRCRVFFPFGPGLYSNMEFANPNYRVPRFFASRFRHQLLTGLLRYFDMNQPWRRDKRDVHLTELEWAQNRAFEKKEEEAESNRDLMRTLLEKRKEEREQYERDRDYLMDAATEQEMKLGAAIKENERLVEENKRLKSGQKSADEISLAIKSEFPGEIKEHLLETISDAIQALGGKRDRRKQILRELLRKNDKPSELPRRREIVERIFKGSKGITDGDFSELARIGIVLVSSNKHYKVRFGTLSNTIPKTPSDWRAGQNQISQMINKFF